MGSTPLNPAVSGASNLRWAGHMGLYLGAVFAGGAATAFVLVVMATGVERIGGRLAWVAIAVAVIALAIGRDLGFNLPVPYRNVQVPQVLRYLLRPSLLAIAYGGQLGLGFATRYTYSTHTAVMLLLPLGLRDPALLGYALFALALGKSVVVMAAAGTTTDDGPRAIDTRLRWRPRGVLTLRIASAAMALLLIISSLTR
jgi:hypothetical protein